MRKIERPKNGWDIPKERKTEFSKEELLDILDFYLQYKPIFDESSTVELDYPPRKAAHDFTLILYKYGIMDFYYQRNMKKIRAPYGKQHVRELSEEKLDFLEIITVFTFIHRAERHAGGWYDDCIADGTYYNLLSRLEEIKNEL